jgi:uncharacterized protein
MLRPFVIDVGEELRRPGTQTSLALVGAMSGVALSSARIVDEAEVSFEGCVEAQGTTVIVQGVAGSEWVGECRRCLEPTGGQVRVELREVFEADPVEGETFPLADERIDLEPVLREALALGLPAAPLCAEDCVGPDPEGHPVGGPNGVTSPEAPRPRDPRWAALDQLRLER